MTFDEFIPIWYEQHPFVPHIKEKEKEISDLLEIDTIIYQKIDWFRYCKEKENTTLDDEDLDAFFSDLLYFFELEFEESSDFSLGYFIEFFQLIELEKAIHYDNQLLSKVNELLKGRSPFEKKIELFLSWVKNRASFLSQVPLGFPMSEAGWMSAFYSAYRHDFLSIRDTDFPAMKQLANYYLWMYKQCELTDRQMMAGDIVKLNVFLIGFMRDVLASAIRNGYYDYEASIKGIIENLKLETESRPSVFISYSWEDTEIANKIEAELTYYANIRRDIHDVKAGDSLSAFMQSIRKQDYAILIVSNSYLQSRNCMYELLELLKTYSETIDFWDNILIYVTATDVYSATGRAKKIQYWTDACSELEKVLSNLPIPALEGLEKEAKILRFISMEIHKLLDHVNDKMCDRDLDVFIKNAKDRLANSAKYGNNPYKDALLAYLKSKEGDNLMADI